MRKRSFASPQWQLVISIAWLVFTVSLASWWWIFSYKQLALLAPSIQPEKTESFRRMILWEGSLLIISILAAGTAMIVLNNREKKRVKQMQIFFSNFAHDLKTSMTRLRVQTEMYLRGNSKSHLPHLLQDLSRLDLQLENSLWIARGDPLELVKEKSIIAEVISDLREEWPELEIKLNRNAHVMADRQAFKSIVRNLIQNSLRHGSALHLDVLIDQKSPGRLTIRFEDDGTGFSGDLKLLGNTLLSDSTNGGNGIGLYLTRFLIEKMQGSIRFETEGKTGFTSIVELPGGFEK